WLLPSWVTVQANVPSGLRASAMDVFWLGLADHWPCRFWGGAGGRGTSSSAPDSPSGLVWGLSPAPAWARSLGFAAPVPSACASCAGSLGGWGAVAPRAAENRAES